ncbi:MAG TPA: 2-octaprenyl-6-methoxyphenyl hydroxylase [Steroidobacteraceae bacterium]
MSAAAPARFDLAIIGGGLVGASLALALRDLPLRVLLIERFAPESASQPSFDERTTALGNGSRRIFEALGVWQEMARDAAPIRAIHVSDAGRFGFARLNALDQGVEAFGYVVPNRVIGAALWGRLRELADPRAGAAARLQLDVRMPAHTGRIDIEPDVARLEVLSDAGAAPSSVHTSLLVAADGAQSSVRDMAGIGSHVQDYEQVAIVVTVGTDRPHDGTAYERFTPGGPLAVLPLANGRYTVVWTLAPAVAARILEADDAQFLAELQRSFGWRAGRFVQVGRRGAYPLALTRADATTAARTVLIGNASQALHPVAGQGFNLGLRDAAALAEMICECVQRGADCGAADELRSFAAQRAADRRGVVGFTDGLVKLFGSTRPGVGALRNLGLLLFDLAPSAKSALARVSWGFAGRTPRLARGLALP